MRLCITAGNTLQTVFVAVRKYVKRFAECLNYRWAVQHS